MYLKGVVLGDGKCEQGGTAGVAQCGSVLRQQPLHYRIVVLAHVKVSVLNKQTQLWLCSNQPSS